MTPIRQVITDDAPKPSGAYSQAVVAGDLMFLSGQIPLDKDGILVEGDVAVQTSQVLDNLEAVLRAEGRDLTSLVKTTVYLARMEDFPVFNVVYAGRVSAEIAPARATTGTNLPPDVHVEIEAIAYLGD